MRMQRNLKTRKYLSLLIWVLCFTATTISIAAFSRAYYGLVWSVSMLLLILPYFYWTHFTARLCEAKGGSARTVLYIRIACMIGFVCLCLMIFLISLPVSVNDAHWEFILSTSPVLFFASLFFCFYMAARALVKSEKSLLIKPSNNFVAFLIFMYLPIGIFFLVPRLKNLYAASSETFD